MKLTYKSRCVAHNLFYLSRNRSTNRFICNFAIRFVFILLSRWYCTIHTQKKLHNYRHRCTDFNKCKPKCLFEQQTNVVRQTNKWFLANYILFTRIFGDTKTVQNFTTNNCSAALIDFSICKMMRRGKKSTHTQSDSTGETLRELSSRRWHKHTYTHSRLYWA